MDQRERRRDIEGDFHAHLTVAADPLALARLPEVAARHRLKLTQIELPCGTVPCQPMVTIFGHGTLADQVARTARWTRTLNAEGQQVIRAKIEAAPGNHGVPRTDAEVPPDHPERYFEHHVKVLLAAHDVAALARHVEPHAIWVSRNARRIRTDGRHERFVTQRCPGVGRTTALARLADLLNLLRSTGYDVIDTEEEYVVHDDHPAVDHGWIADRPMPDTRCCDGRTSGGGTHL